MSKSVQKIPRPFPSVHKSGLPLSEVRDVHPLPVVTEEKAPNGILVAYKDRNENVDMRLRKQKQQMLFAFSLFFMVGLLILAGQVVSKPRMIASTGVPIPVQVNAEPTHVEHDQYDKSCYKGENGEPVCVTRTSRK